MEAGAEHPRAGRLTPPDSGRLLVGIDLGTTNSAVAWTAEDSARHVRPTLFDILQVTSAGETGARNTLPSFLYFLTPEEQATGGMALPWNDRPDAVAGVFARDHGALVPTRQISSAKSWLSNAAVDRRAPLLPWAAEASPKISAVESSARLLSHLCDAWNHAHAGDDERLQQLDVVLTVPASFDEEARELTVEAALQAGLEQFTLLEEPLAVVYGWMAGHPRQLARTLTAGRLLLVCDVGGGTTDFSLIRATTEVGQISFERIAIGEHLLLGGDNVDVALAALAESKLVAGPPDGRRLDALQRQALRRQCSAVKERLLAEDAPERVAITVLGTGRTVVGGAMTTELTREEALAVLNEFLPLVAADERPQRQVRRGLRELGLPYESDPAVTRHLAAFLARAARISSDDAADRSRAAMIRPDAVLFNGGFFTPPVARERILDALASWFGERPSVLENDAPEAAVAIGAAFYAAIRRAPTASSGLLIRAGSARSYYVAVQSIESIEAPGITTAVCVMPRGTSEGTAVVLDREFTVVANQPAAFTLLSSAARSERLGELATFGEGDEVHRHAPLVTALRYGQRSRRVPLKVRLNVIFTEIGTLELWCESIATEHRWRLQFNLRAAESADGMQAPPDDDSAGDQVVIAHEAVEAAEHLLRNTFSTPAGGSRVDALLGELENLVGHGKQEWPLPVIRRLADVLLQGADGRRLSARHEARWLNLAGFCMRPGFGTSLDPWRITQLRKVYVSGLAYPKDVQCQVEWLILWQRVSAGFTASQQQELANKLLGLLGLGARKAPRLNVQMVREAWRLLASLERLDRAQRIRLGDELIARLRRESQNASFLWAAGRFGARIPLYGPLNSLVPPAVAERWLEALRALRAPAGEAVAAVAQISARTEDPARDISDDARQLTVKWLEAAGAPADIVRSLHQPVPLDLLSRSRTFGEALPEGLRLEDVGEAPQR